MLSLSNEPRRYFGSDAMTDIASPPTLNVEPQPKGRKLDGGTKVSVVIPCYNEEDVLGLLYERLDKAAQSWGVDYEIVLVNDGSKDRTWEMMEEIHQKNPRWKMVGLARNFGHQIALWTGLSVASGDVIAVLDADLQDPPEILPQFFQKWTEGFDVVYAVRQKRKEGIFKKVAYFTFYRVLMMLAEHQIPLDSGDFCVMDARVVKAITSSAESRPFIRGLRAWVGFKQTSLPYERHARAAGEVKYTFTKLVRLALDGILSSSTKPLRLASLMGGIVSVFAFLAGVMTVIQRVYAKWFSAEPLPGYATIVVGMLFLGGVQLLCIGILGEYIGRIYENVSGRPISVIAEMRGVKKRSPSPLAGDRRGEG